VLVGPTAGTLAACCAISRAMVVRVTSIPGLEAVGKGAAALEEGLKEAWLRPYEVEHLLVSLGGLAACDFINTSGLVLESEGGSVRWRWS
jgi:hypothetical protein